MCRSKLRSATRRITTTMRYVHPTPEHKRQAMDKLEQFNLEQALLAHTQTRGPYKSPYSDLFSDFPILLNC